MTTLYQAAEAGNVAEVQRLLAAGVPVDTIENAPANWSPLMVAAHRGHQDVVAVLIAAGANLNSEDYDYFSAVTLAGSQKQWEVLRSLAEHGADFGAAAGNGVTGIDYVLRCRSQRKRTEIFQILQRRLEGTTCTPEASGHRVTGIVCSRCGKPRVSCQYYWSGFGDSWDNFAHRCENPECGQVRERTGIAGKFPRASIDDGTRCPFCGRSSELVPQQT